MSSSDVYKTLRLCSHDAGTGRKRHEKVTFSLSVHTMPVRNCTIPSLLDYVHTMPVRKTAV